MNTIYTFSQIMFWRLSIFNIKGEEVPIAKLSALHKVLQSDFLRAIKEIYEHVCDTVEMRGSHDVRASATVKATIAAFAASEGHAHPCVVELPKTDEGLGFNVMWSEVIFFISRSSILTCK